MKKKISKKFFLIIGSLLALFFGILQIKGDKILNNLGDISVANADIIVPPDPPAPPPDPGCGGCSSSG